MIDPRGTIPIYQYWYTFDRHNRGEIGAAQALAEYAFYGIGNAAITVAVGETYGYSMSAAYAPLVLPYALFASAIVIPGVGYLESRAAHEAENPHLWGDSRHGPTDIRSFKFQFGFGSAGI